MDPKYREGFKSDISKREIGTWYWSWSVAHMTDGYTRSDFKVLFLYLDLLFIWKNSINF